MGAGRVGGRVGGVVVIMLARDVLGILKLESGERWLDIARDWQREDVLQVLEGERPYNYLTRSRGSSKTTDLGAVGASVTAAADERLRSYWLASDADQARLAIDTIAGFCARTPALTDRLEVQTRRVVAPESGAELVILPADAAGTWGLTPHWVFVDEIANWADVPSSHRLWEAASSAVAKRSDARMVLLTTASRPDHFAYKVVEHARSSSLWRVSERHGPSPWMDPARLAEQQARLPDSVFRQLFLNEWTAAEGAFLTEDAVADAFVLDGATGADRTQRSYHAALDLGSVNDRTAFAVTHREGAAVCLDWLAVWKGSKATPVQFAEVEDVVAEAHRSYGFRLSYDRWQALDLAQRLRGRGVYAHEYVFSQANKTRLAQTLLSLLNGRNLRLYDVPGLKEELLGLRLVQASNGAWAFDHSPGAHDDMCVAISMASVSALERSTPAAPAGLRRRLDLDQPISRGILDEKW